MEHWKGKYLFPFHIQDPFLNYKILSRSRTEILYLLLLCWCYKVWLISMIMLASWFWISELNRMGHLVTGDAERERPLHKSLAHILWRSMAQNSRAECMLPWAPYFLESRERETELNYTCLDFLCKFTNHIMYPHFPLREESEWVEKRAEKIHEGKYLERERPVPNKALSTS